VNGLRAAAIACLLAFSAAHTMAEEQHVPVPYAPDEFPAWTQDLRRAEIIFFGSLPFSLFFTFEAYDVGKFVVSGFDALVSPWPLRAGAEIWAGYSTAEKGWLIASAFTLSLGVSVADFLIRHRPAKREDR
jgi:hypothetical protein